MIAFGHNPRVEIRRGPGLYVFADYAGTGKSFLAHLIGLACEGGMPYVPYTYLDYWGRGIPQYGTKTTIAGQRSGDGRLEK